MRPEAGRACGYTQPRPDRPPPPLQQCDTLLAGVKEAQQHNEVTG